jgi:flagellar hook protein FlgE
MSFQQGLSGLNAISQQLDVIGNNIANSGTYGAKESTANFADLYAGAINGTGGSASGIGVNMTGVTQSFTQGSITTTGNSLDMAINGGGFFQLNASGNTVYSRNGQFQLNSSGNIVNSTGQQLLGYAASTTGMIIPSTVAPLTLPTAGVAPAPTTKTSLQVNLDSRQAATVPAVAPFINFTDPTTYNNATGVTVYDAKGQAVSLTYYFQKTASDTWNIYATANGQSVTAPLAPIATGVPFNPATGTLAAAFAGVPPFNVPSVPLTGGGTSSAITGVALSLTGATQYGASFSVTSATQDGFSPGQLTGVSIDKAGVITAQYSNNQSKAVGQLVLANFRNPQGLQPLGGNTWAPTANAGTPIIGAAGQGNLGTLQSGALESSNIDLTTELVNMMTAQRSYQANSQTIKTEDQVMQTLLNLR